MCPRHDLRAQLVSGYANKARQVELGIDQAGATTLAIPGVQFQGRMGGAPTRKFEILHPNLEKVQFWGVGAVPPNQVCFIVAFSTLSVITVIVIYIKGYLYLRMR